MISISDGRNELYQWDTGRTLTVDADCSQIHFSNKIFGRSIDVDVVDGVAIIPDVLLQTDKDLIAWAFVGTAENGYTKISKTFKVNRRNKPADYVFTPTGQTSLEEIKEKLEYLESIQDPDAIKNAVDEYLANNPIQVEEKDPTVPVWAKQPTKPKYTADEVGAVATVNGQTPDENGNVEIDIPEGGTGSGLTTAQLNALDGLFKIAAYTEDASGAYAAFKTAFGITDSGDETATLSSISATYSGGDVAVGTALTDLTGIVVTAVYADGSTAVVTGYTLSGEITDGENTITVTYESMTATFTVTGVADSSGGEEEPDEPEAPEVVTYTVSVELVNVTSSNAVTSVNENASYTATLTAAEGYELDSVTVTMGGVDITATAYADGVITIAAVTGNVEIVASASVAAVEPELPEDGLAGYWDMRNRDESTADAYNWHWAFPCDKGNGLYANITGGSQGTIAFTSDAYGSKHNFYIQDDATLYPGESEQKAFGNNYTFAILAYGGKITQGSGNSNGSYFDYKPSYFKLDGSKTNVAVGGIGDNTLSTTYSLCVYVASGETLTLYINGEKMNELNGSDYDDFAKWYDKLLAGTHYSDGKIAAIAAYSKALTETEIVELTAFMKTLEVTA